MSGGVDVKKYPWVEDLGQPVPRVAMRRAPRMQVPGGTTLPSLSYLAGSLILPGHRPGPRHRGRVGAPPRNMLNMATPVCRGYRRTCRWKSGPGSWQSAQVA